MLIAVWAATVIFLTPAFGDSTSAEYTMLYDPDFHLYWLVGKTPDTRKMTWKEANAWAENLSFGGYDDWSLPDTPDGTWGYDNKNVSTKYNVTESDLGHVYYSLLELDPDEGINTTSSPFTNLQAGYYWFGSLSKTCDDQNNPMGWIFDFRFGTQFLASTNTKAYAIAVRHAPEPSTILLFLAGLLALCRTSCEKKRQLNPLAEKSLNRA